MVSFLIVSNSFFEITALFGAGLTPVILLSICFLVGIAVVFFVISCEYNFVVTIVRKIYNKTILNKFLSKCLNAIFVKLWLVF